MAFFLTVLGVVLVVEGIPWFLSPERARSLLRHLAGVPAEALRTLGFFLMLLGLVLVWFGTRQG